MSGVLEPWLVWTTEHLVSEVKCSPYIEENRFVFLLVTQCLATVGTQ